jgi:acetyl esterase
VFNACYVDPETAKQSYASPIFASREQLTGLPPALLIVAGCDSLHDEGIQYAQMLQAAGVAVELHDFAQAAHGFTYNKTPDAQKAQALMADFIHRQNQST